jgi:hypothetical protein
MFSAETNKAHLGRTAREFNATRPDELDTIAIFLVEAHGNLSVYRRFPVLVAGKPDVLGGNDASVDLGKHCGEVILNRCRR